jgi:dihydrofolate reductase
VAIFVLAWAVPPMFIVQGSSSDDSSASHLTVATRQEAVDVARRWLDRGKTVRIIGGGRLYFSLDDFSATSLQDV